MPAQSAKPAPKGSPAPAAAELASIQVTCETAQGNLGKILNGKPNGAGFLAEVFARRDVKGNVIRLPHR